MLQVQTLQGEVTDSQVDINLPHIKAVEVRAHPDNMDRLLTYVSDHRIMQSNPLQSIL